VPSTPTAPLISWLRGRSRRSLRPCSEAQLTMARIGSPGVALWLRDPPRLHFEARLVGSGDLHPPQCGHLVEQRRGEFMQRMALVTATACMTPLPLPRRRQRPDPCCRTAPRR
jgi:hypothetical protein